MRLDHLLLGRNDIGAETYIQFSVDRKLSLVSFLFVFNKKYAFPKVVEGIYFRKGEGGIAQLVEHLPCKQGVIGSNPITSTNMGS